MREHETDIQKWLLEFPLELVEGDWKEAYGSIQAICSPRDLAGMEHIRAKVSKSTNLGRKVSTDVFLFSKGEPDQRWATKIGGLPYRPKTINDGGSPKKNPWPLDVLDEPMTFLAQFCFADSKDLIGEVPGDVLLIFADGEDCDPDSFVFEWYPLGLKDLITPDQVPPQVFCRRSDWPILLRPHLQDS